MKTSPAISIEMQSFLEGKLANRSWKINNFLCNKKFAAKYIFCSVSIHKAAPNCAGLSDRITEDAQN